MGGLRAEYQALKTGRWDGFAGYDGWFARANNATLGVQGSYDELVPGFERLFQRSGGDFARFHAEVRTLAALPKPQRDAELTSPPEAPAALTPGATPPADRRSRIRGDGLLASASGTTEN
jgi:predicted aminopeptidase